MALGEGPLAGLRFVEMAGMGPAPFASMILADLGAEGIRIESPKKSLEITKARTDVLRRGRTSMVVDISEEAGRQVVIELCRNADILIEGFRPGVMERRGLGPDDCFEVNPRLVYGRLTGWGQDGPLARVAGHDLDYVAVAGVLAHIGRRGQPPTPPINLVGDFGGGSMLLLVGQLAALWETQRSGVGQVVEAAMIDGSALLMSMMHGLAAGGRWSDEAGVNLLDSGTPFYDVYGTKDGKWLAVACLEPKVYADRLDGAGLAGEDLPDQHDLSGWPILRERFAEVVATKTRDEWVEIFDGRDACVAPVLTMHEAPLYPHNRERGNFIEIDGIVQPAPAPRFSRTPTSTPAKARALEPGVTAQWTERA